MEWDCVWLLSYTTFSSNRGVSPCGGVVEVRDSSLSSKVPQMVKLA